LAGLVCATDGATLAAGEVAAGGVLAVTAGVVAATEAAGVGLAAGVVAAVAGVLAGVVAGLVLSAAGVVDAFALASAAFLSFRFCFMSAAGVMLVAGCSVEAFGAFVSGAVVAGAVAAGAGFRCFLSTFGGGGGSLADGGWAAAAGSFIAGASGLGACAGGLGAFAGTSVFGPGGFTSAGAFFSCFLPGGCDSSGDGCWAITAPASASEHTINSLVIVFMLIWVGRSRARSIQCLSVSCPARSIALPCALNRSTTPTWLPRRLNLQSAICNLQFRNHPAAACCEILLASNCLTSPALLAVTGIRTDMVDCVFRRTPLPGNVPARKTRFYTSG
jgi:hypothetical protein